MKSYLAWHQSTYLDSTRNSINLIYELWKLFIIWWYFWNVRPFYFFRSFVRWKNAKNLLKAKHWCANTKKILTSRIFAPSKAAGESSNSSRYCANIGKPITPTTAIGWPIRIRTWLSIDFSCAHIVAKGNFLIYTHPQKQSRKIKRIKRAKRVVLVTVM